MNRRPLLVLAMAGALSFPAVAMDHGDESREPHRAVKALKQMDANGDEIVTKAEFEASPMAQMIKSFDALGPNESGQITKDDFIETMVKMHPETKNEA